MGAAVVLEPFVDADRDLGRETMPRGEHRSADHGSEARVYQNLPAYDHEDPGALGVTSGGALDAIEIAAFHSGVW